MWIWSPVPKHSFLQLSRDQHEPLSPLRGHLFVPTWRNKLCSIAQFVPWHLSLNPPSNTHTHTHTHTQTHTHTHTHTHGHPSQSLSSSLTMDVLIPNRRADPSSPFLIRALCLCVWCTGEAIIWPLQSTADIFWWGERGGETLSVVTLAHSGQYRFFKLRFECLLLTLMMSSHEKRNLELNLQFE